VEIVEDEAGRKLVLAQTAPRVPLVVVLSGVAIALLVAAPWRWIWERVAHGVDRGSADLAYSGVWLLLGLLLVSSLLRGVRLERFAVDRVAAGIDWQFSHFAGIPGLRRHVDLNELEGLELKLLPTSKGVVRREAKGGLPLRLTLRPGRGESLPLDLRIARVDRVEALAELGLRLGAAAGLSHYRVLGNDPHQFAIEILRSSSPAGRDVQGLKPVPDLSGNGEVTRAAAAAVSEETLPPFDPRTFEGKPRVTVWAPGREVRFEKTWSAELLLAPLLVAALAGPIAWLLLPSLQVMPVLPRIATLCLITLVGLAVAVIGWVSLKSGLPRGATLDWSSARLVVEGGRQPRTIAFSEISAIEVFTRTYRGRTGYRQYYLSYCCEIRAVLRGDASPSAPVLLTETPSYREDPTTPLVMALPLSAELSSSLGVERRTTEGPRSSSRPAGP
jgi:hypothetical protein